MGAPDLTRPHWASLLAPADAAPKQRRNRGRSHGPASCGGVGYDATQFRPRRPSRPRRALGSAAPCGAAPAAAARPSGHLLATASRPAPRRHARASCNKQPGRPRTVRSILALVLRLARENSNWGYRRIHGELATLGIKIAASTVWEILRHEAIDPAPQRTTLTWAPSSALQDGDLMAEGKNLKGHFVVADETSRAYTTGHPQSPAPRPDSGRFPPSASTPTAPACTR